jgi:hypothetical protein
MPATWGAQQWARFTKEQTWGTFHGTASTPDAGATVLWPRLLEGGIEMMAAPPRWVLRSADGGNLKNQVGSQRLAITGRFRTPVYPAQAVQLIPWFATPTGSGSARALDSWTIDWQDGLEVRRFLGVRPGRGVLSCEESDQGVILMLEMEFVAKDQVADGTITLAEPSVSDFPTTRPYTLTDMSGQLSVAGGARTGIRSARIEYTNFLYTRFHEGTRIDRANYRGRDVSVALSLADPTTTERTRFENVTGVALSLGWDIAASPNATLTFDMQGNTYATGRTVSRAFSEDEYTDLTFEAFKDQSTGTDAAATVSYSA